MTTKKVPGSTAGGPYTIELDEALLQEALAAVDTRRARPSPSAAPPATPAARPAADDEGVEIVLDEAAGEGGPAREDMPTADAGLDLGKMAVEWERLVRELDQVREERDVARRRLEAETREKTRFKLAAARVSASADELRDALVRAEEGRRAAETEAARLRDELRMATDGVTRLRERMRRSEEEARQHGHGPVVLGLLPVLENLERASQHAEESPHRVVEGLRMVLDQFRTALQRVGVQRVAATPGTPFQPAVHEAVTHTPTREQPPGSVLVELQAGYMLNGRLLQAARVAVAAPPTLRPGRSLAEGEVLALSDEVSDGVDGVDLERSVDRLEDSVSTSH